MGEVERQHQEMDRPGVGQGTDSSEKLEELETTGWKVICGAQ